MKKKSIVAIVLVVIAIVLVVGEIIEASLGGICKFNSS